MGVLLVPQCAHRVRHEVHGGKGMMRKHAGSRRRVLWLALAALLVLTSAGLVVWQSAVRADRQMRTDLLQ